MKTKKAGERLLSLYLFVIYIIVAVGIVSGVILFYGNSLDIREFEAKALNDRIIDCISKQGNLNENFGKDFNVEKNCNLMLNEDYGIRIKNIDSDEIVLAGNQGFFGFCNLKGEKLPKCFQREIYVLSKDKGVFIEITSVVNKINKNVK